VLRKLLQCLRTPPSPRSAARRRPRCRPAPELLEGRLAPAVLTVDSPADDTTADSALTLREAVALVDGTLGRGLTPAEQAQVSGTLGSSDAIQFNLPGGPQTIPLTLGALAITNPVTITGPGANNLTVDGSGLDRVFVVGQIFTQDLSLNVSISGLTVSGGSQDFGAGLLNFGTLTVSAVTFSGNAAGSTGGGGIYNVGSLTVRNSTFTNNSVTNLGAGAGILNNSAGTLIVTGCTFTDNKATAGSSGGGISNSGTASVSGSTFDHNTVDSNGAGIHNSGTGNLTVTNCTFTNGSAVSDGGGIDNDGTLTLTGSTFADNVCGSEGGALDSHGSAPQILNCTFVGNTAHSRGGAINSSGVLQLVNCTLTGNRLTSDTGIGGGVLDSVAAQLFNTIVAGNFQGAGTDANDVGGTLDPASSYNLIGTGGAGGLSDGVNHNQVGVSDAGLGPLADNGGPTLTVLPLPGSPAIDHGSTTYVTPGETDQRGLPRVVNGAPDVGAVEVQPPPAETVQFHNASPFVQGTGGVIQLTVDRLGDTDGTVNVPFQVTDGSAHAGTDYQVLTASPLVFQPGVARVTITLNLFPHSDAQGDRSFRVSLGTPTSPDDSADPTLGPAAFQTVTVLEPETFQVSGPATVGEDGGAATFTVTRVGSTDGAATVRYSISGSAVPGVDFAPPSGTLTIPAGQAQGTITIPILNDGQVGGNKLLTVTLTGATLQGAPNAASVGAHDSATLTILETNASPPPRGITARLVRVKVGKKRRLMVEVFFADTGALKVKFVAPFQAPTYKAIHLSMRDRNGDGVPDQLVLTARKGKRTVTDFFAG
jgi:predicted outer membrane repeat protein